MARPSLKDQRKEEILDAFETCIARHGVEGASLERIAEEAGLARALIRHNIGNREELLAALVDRFVARSGRVMDRLICALPEKRRLESLIDALFDPAFSDTQLVLVSEALIAAAANDPALARKMRKWLKGFVETVAEVIRRSCPDTDEGKVQAVAAGLTGIYFTVESVMPLGPMKELRAASRAAALSLAGSVAG